MNTMYEVNLILSATAPTTRPGVMMANISWNNANKVRGMVIGPAAPCKIGAPELTPLKNKKVVGFPINPPIVSPKLKLNPTVIHNTLTTPAATTLLIIVEITFLR